MKPERLKWMRDFLFFHEGRCDPPVSVYDGAILYELVADRDYWEAAHRCAEEARKNWKAMADALRAERDRYRARCPVTAEDVEAAGVTAGHCWRWFVSKGFSQSRPTRDCGFYHLIGNWGPVVAHGYAHTGWTSEDIARLINTTSWRGPARDILDEMAATEAD